MLSPRLKSIANFVDKGDKIIDIGCDHAYLSIYLVKKKQLNSALVSDINPNALGLAIKNINQANLTKKITPFLSDGLENLPLTKINTIIISGMGTTNIIKILANIPKNITKLIIQSNNHYYELRKFITKKGFYLSDENITKDKNKYYLTIKFERGTKYYQEKDYYFGIIKKNNKGYYLDTKNKYESILTQIPKYRFVPRLKLKNLIKYLNKIVK